MPTTSHAGGLPDYCHVNTATAYSLNMPGITRVTLDTFDRQSQSLECGEVGCNSYVEISDFPWPNLRLGDVYTISITHTRDEVIFPDVRNNIRVWIDYNGDLEYAESEAVVSLDYQTFGTTTATFQVPSDAQQGVTGMRIAVKMSSDGGHTAPTPCDDPPDPLGFHGEIEDYRVDLYNDVANSVDADYAASAVKISPNPASGIVHLTMPPQFTGSALTVLNSIGREVYKIDNTNHSDIDLDLSAILTGSYYIIMRSNNGQVSSASLTLMP
ncbi:MAG: T9SS type A sorting domain-containing protein [Ignavibacteria bacterium]|nr:T9SS type A sorting domain-containing protein [Ignavibacteria bacterium]